MTEAQRYYIPLCLYPHTKYRRRAGIIELIEKFDLRSSAFIMIVADELLVLDRLVTGRFWTVESARKKARYEAENVMRMVRRTISKEKAGQAASVIFWEGIADTDGYRNFSNALRPRLTSDAVLSPRLEEFVERRVAKFGLGSKPDIERSHELEYLLSEVCMSTYCTEVLGFETEVWERPPGPDVPDVLKILYEERVELVAGFLGRPARRKLKFLYDEPSPHTDNPTAKSESFPDPRKM